MSIETYKLLLDQPSQCLALGFEDYVKALAGVIEKSEPRYAIGIIGSWGSGKTTLMRSIQDQMNPEQTISVWFNAWRYEREEHLIIPLLDTLRESLQDWAEKYPYPGLEARRAADVIADVVHAMITGLELKVGIPQVAEFKFDANRALSQAEYMDFEEAKRHTPRSTYHASFKALKEIFQEFVGNSESRIVIFIDDVDRCLPDQALQILKSMKLFFDLEGFVFVVGLDENTIVAAINEQYKHAVGATFGGDYIKKLFQVLFNIPPVSLNDLDGFMEVVYKESRFPIDQENEIKDVVEPHLRYLITESGINPRELKRYINSYTLQRKIKPDLEKDAVLALKTLAFRQDWQHVYTALLTYRKIFLDELADYLELSSPTNTFPTSGFSRDDLPSTFYTYVSESEPGHMLIEERSGIDAYIYSSATIESRSDPHELHKILKSISDIESKIRRTKDEDWLRQALLFSSELMSVLDDGYFERLNQPAITRLIKDIRSASKQTDPVKEFILSLLDKLKLALVKFHNLGI